MALAGSQFEVLGPLGRDPEGEHAFLARELPRNRLVVLKRQRGFPPQSADPGTLHLPRHNRCHLTPTARQKIKLRRIPSWD